MLLAPRAFHCGPDPDEVPTVHHFFSSLENAAQSQATARRLTLKLTPA
jgi:hypothetical protein